MDIKNVAIIVFDEKENFEKTKKYIADERQVKSLNCVNSLAEFDAVIKNLIETDYICLVVHVFYTQNIMGVINFKSSRINKVYPLIEAMYVSEGIANDIKHEMLDQKIQMGEIYKYHQIIDNIENNLIKLCTQKELLSKNKEKCIDKPNSPMIPKNNLAQIDFAIITALYDHEFSEVKKLIDWDEPYRTKTKLYRIGCMKDNPSIRIVAAVPSKTGMIDSAIIATQMLELFKPKYLLMSGVCGGKKSLKFGDIVLASSVFTFQKGKISDLLDAIGQPIKLYDRQKNEIDLSKIYDYKGNQINVTVENFEREQDVIEIDPLVKDYIEDGLESIMIKINEQYDEQKIGIHFEPMACSSMVINKNGYFEENVKIIERKSVAIEMEGFGVARACKFANDGKTKFVVFKSVMDNMVDKSDKAKELAGYTSAQFLKYLIIDNVLK